MTSAHRLLGVLMRRCRGARAVAIFTKTDATRERIAVQFEAATPNDDPAARLGDGILQPAFSAHLATRGCDKEARVVPAIRGANFNAADAHSRADRDADNRISARPPSRDITHCPGRSSARPAALFNASTSSEIPPGLEVVAPGALVAAPIFNGRNAGVDRIGERGAVGDGSHAVGALICARPHAKTARRTKREIDARPSTISNAVSNAERPSHGCPVGYRDNTGCCASVRYTVASTPFARALLPKALAGTRWSAMTAPNSVRQRLARFAAGLCRLPRHFSSLCVHGAFCAPRAFVNTSQSS